MPQRGQNNQATVARQRLHTQRADSAAAAAVSTHLQKRLGVKPNAMKHVVGVENVVVVDVNGCDRVNAKADQLHVAVRQHL